MHYDYMNPISNASMSQFNVRVRIPQTLCQEKKSRTRIKKKKNRKIEVKKTLYIILSYRPKIVWAFNRVCAATKRSNVWRLLLTPSTIWICVHSVALYQPMFLSFFFFLFLLSRRFPFLFILFFFISNFQFFGFNTRKKKQKNKKTERNKWNKINSLKGNRWSWKCVKQQKYKKIRNWRKKNVNVNMYFTWKTRVDDFASDDDGHKQQN